MEQQDIARCIDLLSEIEIKKLNDLKNKANQCMEVLNAEFTAKFSESENQDPELVKAENVQNFFRFLMKTINSSATCIERLVDFVRVLTTVNDVQTYVYNSNRPLIERLIKLESLVKLMSENNKHKDSCLSDLMDGHEKIEEDLNSVKTSVKNLEDKNYDRNLQANVRTSTPFHEFSSMAVHNKDLKIPIFSNKTGDKPIKFLNELKEYVEAQPNSDLKVINNSLIARVSDGRHIVRSEVHNFEDFENIFVDSFWSVAIRDEYEKKLRFA